jgi:hypothetical protein
LGYDLKIDVMCLKNNLFKQNWLQNYNKNPSHAANVVKGLTISITKSDRWISL